jgi:hypothetical protein
MKKIRPTKGHYFYTPESYKDSGKITVVFRALSHGELISLETLIEAKRYSEANYRAVEFAVIKIEDSFGNPSIAVNDLSTSLIEEIADRIFRMSEVTRREYEQLKSSTNIYFDPTYQTDSWKCEICREKRLDRVRNCGFRGEKDKDPNFVAYVNNQPYKYCPIYDVNKELLSDAVECYNAYDANLLPDSGGLYDQTRFFVLSSQEIFMKLKEQEKKELEKLKKQK